MYWSSVATAQSVVWTEMIREANIFFIEHALNSLTSLYIHICVKRITSRQGGLSLLTETRDLGKEG